MNVMFLNSKKYGMLLCSVLFFLCLHAQEKPEAHISAKKITEKISIDGDLNEGIWQTAQKAGDFWQSFPYDTSFSKTKTEAMVAYDESYLYIAAICYDSIPGKYVIQSLKRDFSYPISDAFSVVLDPFSDMQNGFSFGVNPYGVQREGLIAFGGSQGVTTNWDNKWLSEVKRYPNKWTVEMAIPYKTLRFKENLKQWRINFTRNDLKRNESSSWQKVPRQFNITTLAFTGFLDFESEAPKKNGANIALIPYGITRFSEDYRAQSGTKLEGNAGLDSKIAINAGLNLDVTVNPDFSQVEVDRQITNLTRFSLFFPEQRQFFLENSDLFERFGFRQIRPFFSRRVGLDNGNIIPIIAGARLSGKPGKNWRIGVMDIQTAESNFNFTPVAAQNYFVGAVQRNVFKRSNISLIAVNRQQLDGKGLSANNYNRVFGLDYNLASSDNKWLGKLFFHHSFSNLNNGNAFAHASWLNYSSQNLQFEWNHEYVDKNYRAESGFTPRIFQTDGFGKQTRNTYWRLEPHASYFFYPKSSWLNKTGPSFFMDYYANQKFENTDATFQGTYGLYFTNTAFIGLDYQNTYTKLIYPTDVTFSGKAEVLDSAKYYYNNVRLNLKSNQRKTYVLSASGAYGSYFSGEKLSYSVDASLRLQPYAIISVNYTHDEIKMPYLSKAVNLDLISPRVELSLTRSLFITTFWQYNSQLKNINFNGRLQWRFKPMSDLFIVYSDNYDNIDFSVKNRAIVAKFVYWFGV
jgi:hypothetical protein